MEEKLDETFYVEKILDKKIVRGKAKYLIRWIDYDESYDSWEPLSCLKTCEWIVDAFNKEREAQKEKDKGEKVKSKETVRPTMIIGATDMHPNKPGIQFLIEFSDGKKKLIPREEVHHLCPQLLINFYEQNMVWNGYEEDIVWSGNEENIDPAEAAKE